MVELNKENLIACELGDILIISDNNVVTILKKIFAFEKYFYFIGDNIYSLEEQLVREFKDCSIINAQVLLDNYLNK